MSSGQLLFFGLFLGLFTSCRSEQKNDTAAKESSCPDGRSELTLNQTKATPEWARQLFKVKLDGAKHLNVKLTVSDDSRHVEAVYSVDGIDICNATTTANLLGNRITVAGYPLSRIKALKKPADLVWPRPETHLNRIQGRLKTKDFILRQAKPCYGIEGDALTAALELSVFADKMPYRVQVNNQGIDQVEPLFFGATGSATVYAGSPDTSELEVVKLTDLSNTGYLCSSDFRTHVPVGFEAAFSEDKEFHYDIEDIRFQETAVYANAMLMANWFKKNKGVINWHKDQVQLYLHELFGGAGPNNAAYVPAVRSFSGFPEVKIGDGDGAMLKNLPLDPEVVAHELGHHLLFNYVKSARDESAVIHEALADFFVFAKTEDPCLAGSVCPADSPVCWQTECLRSADNQLKFTDTDLPTDQHQRSQLVSGMLWDLAQADEFSLVKVNELVLHSLKFLSTETSYSDFVVGLMSADVELTEGKHSCDIFDEAIRRGLAEKLKGINCATFAAK